MLTEPAPEIDDAQLAGLLAAHWSLDTAPLQRLGAERDLNIAVGDDHVLKVSNPAEPRQMVETETAAMAHARQGLERCGSRLQVPEVVPDIRGERIVPARDGRGRSCAVRLFTRLPGADLEGSIIDTDLARRAGATAATMQRALDGFAWTTAARALDWDIRRLPQMPSAVADPRLGPLVGRVTPALAATDHLRAGVRHGDVTLSNMLTRDGRITGIIDFGDLHHTADVCDLAICLTSVLRNSGPDQTAGPWDLLAAVVDGYQQYRPLEADEADLLGELVLARLVVTEALSRRRARDHGDNAAHITRYDTANTRMLDLLGTLTADEMRRRITRLAGTSRAVIPGGDDGDRLLRRRRHVMGDTLAPLMYDEPLQIVRGRGPWVFTADGHRLLDAYNNVAVVGHAHPTVTQAITRQLALLNTHSRYLHTDIVELAERIVATMPDGLDTVLFTTSGTEANELAWRLATAATGGDGAIVGEFAYHGSTRWMADLSPNEWPAGHRPPHVATFEAPHGLAADSPASLASARVADAAARLGKGGSRPALVLADSMFTSEGILDTPDGFLRGLQQGAHAAGALYLADEVQAGYGRSGPQLWRFALSDAVPDIVTLGKPMGAGYPLGAVVTRADIAAQLAQRYEYFSTFAATPVAAAAGLAVLDVLTDRGIPQRAVRVGEYLRTGLRDLGGSTGRIGQVRGIGLVAGADLVAPDGVPGRPWARQVLQRLVAEGVIAGLTGRSGTVLKVRPPLVWEQHHVDLLLTRLHRALEPDG